MLAMTGRVTMLGISRWTEKGGSYRTVQRFFHTVIPWATLFWLFFHQHLYRSEDVYLLAGDECVVTKSGKQTHGLDRFFSSLYGKAVPSLEFFALSLVSLSERRSYPIMVEQVVRTNEEKAVAKAKAQARKAKRKQKKKGKLGRPKGSKNRDKTQVTLTSELTRIQQMVQKLLRLIESMFPLRYLVMDGKFGNNNALQMTLQCGLHLISKLRHDAALHFVYDGPYAGKGAPQKYGDKINYAALPDQYRQESSTEGEIQTDIYQAQMLHRDFAQALNVVIIHKTNLITGATAHVVLFSSDLELTYAQIIDYYSLRFQIEIVFTQMTKTRYFPLGRSRDDIADFHFVVIHNNTVNEQFNQLPALGETQRLQSRSNTLTKRLNVLAQFEGINMFFSLHLQLTQLLF
jgi:putative transposase